MKFILDVIKGVFIGSGAILPGISSGVFCVIFGIYEKLVDSVLNIFKDLKKKKKQKKKRIFLFYFLLHSVELLEYCLLVNY